MKIGIPRSIYYYYYYPKWKYFFKYLEIDTIVSPDTNKEIIELGSQLANDEMCLSLKIFLGHVAYLQDKCDYILIPRIDNYGLNDQTCTNFLSTYDIANNLLNIKILNYNIDIYNNQTEKKAFLKLGKQLGKKRKNIIKAYEKAGELVFIEKLEKIKINEKKLESKKHKILIVGHPYNIYDSYVGKPIMELLKNYEVEVIYCDLFLNNITNKKSKLLSKELYFKFNKEIIGAIPLCENKIDGIIFITTFPCGPDSLVNELVIRKITLPYLNLIVDDVDSQTGIETRIESFLDIVLERNKNE
ncbi:MAG: acyl-CoA dehydratase activase-related protein [Bacilli bacterium]